MILDSKAALDWMTKKEGTIFSLILEMKLNDLQPFYYKKIKASINDRIDLEA